jgi:hypothetical protein
MVFSESYGTLESDVDDEFAQNKIYAIATSETVLGAILSFLHPINGDDDLNIVPPGAYGAQAVSAPPRRRKCRRESAPEILPHLRPRHSTAAGDPTS